MLFRPSALLLAFSLASAPSAWAWSRLGHAEVAHIAEARLDPPVLAEVKMLLRNDLDATGVPSGRKTLADVASWPDEIRDLAPDRAYQGWHGRANPVCGGGLAPCPDGHCVDELIEHYGAILQNRGNPLRERNEALKWVVHLTGDLHQPLHSGVAKDHGKAPVHSIRGKALKPGTTLHNVWDNQLAKIALAGWRCPDQPEGVEAGGSPRQWMLESRAVSRHHVYEPIPGFDCRKALPQALDLDDAYVQQAISAIRLQIGRAGLRLAARLNQWLAAP
ncbi:MAG TPA: S1/P1 nuclease [Holophaga sp.]|nr:S1/P1 nuclease [Holophaga sp.]